VIVFPDWDRPENIHIAVTNRFGGLSGAPFGFFNLATHVGDNKQAVLDNRRILCRELDLKDKPIWLNQVHGSEVLRIESNESDVESTREAQKKADGVYTQLPGIPLVIMTADCMPILICNREGTEIAAVHAGWRGLAAGIIEKVLGQFTTEDLLVLLGPAIDVCHYEVDSLVRREFDCTASFTPSNTPLKSADHSSKKDHWMFDLYHEASRQLRSLGVNEITMQRHCTYCDDSLYSFRRDGQTGRFASLIWKSS